MDNLFYSSVVMIGVCFVLKYGSILNFIRTPLKRIKFFNELFSCSLCMGFHIGIWKSIIFDTPTWGNVLSSGFYASVICWFADHIIDVMQVYIYKRD